MEKLTFITGNQDKADRMAKYADHAFVRLDVDLDEIQGLDQSRIIEHKARQAYDLVKGPVVVEDVSLEFTALGRLPGTYIKSFLEELGLDGTCRLLDGYTTRQAIARCMIGFCNGDDVTIFEGSLEGTITDHPVDSNNGFGWDKIFIPQGYDVTRAELSQEDDDKTYLQLKPIAS